MKIDHVVYAVRDLDDAAEHFERAHGLVTVPGGRHPSWGTMNRIAPLGRDYVELLAVTDLRAATESVLGTRLLDLTADGDRWFSVCIADEQIDETARRLGLPLHTGARTRPDGTVVTWRHAGIDDRARTLDLPFFIAWDDPALHPGRPAADHPSGATGIAAVEVTGDPRALGRWLGGADVPIEATPGPPAVAAVRLSTNEGERRIG